MVGETDSKATTRLLLAEAVILGLVPAHCWVDLGPGFCGYRALGGVLGLVPWALVCGARSWTLQCVGLFSGVVVGSEVPGSLLMGQAVSPSS